MIKLTSVNPFIKENFRFFVPKALPSTKISAVLSLLTQRIQDIEKFKIAPSQDSIIIRDLDGDLYDFNEPLRSLEKFS